MPTVVAQQYNSTIKAIYDRLVPACKPKMVATIDPPPQSRWHQSVIGSLLVLMLASPTNAAVAGETESTQLPSGDAVIRAPAGDSEIVITTTARLAGSIHSLTWNGREFIDSFDHGRQLQSALNCDAGAPIAAEAFNPTEAGSRRDGAGPISTSRLLHFFAHGNQMQTTTQMAFWLAPGEKSGPHLARNTASLSNHLVTKRVTIGVDGQPQLIGYDVTFSLPVDERHGHIVFEALTGYMPPEFDQFWRFDPVTQQLVPLSDGPGEQADPVVLSTAGRDFAMGVIARPASDPDIQGPTYGRFRFSAERVVKWNCVYRWRQPAGIPAGDYRFTMKVVVGSLSQVESLLRDQTLTWSAPTAITTPGNGEFSR